MKTNYKFGGRVLAAFGNSLTGFRHAALNETAFRQELLALVILVPVSVMLPVTRIEHLILVLSMMLVLLVELINTSIEATVDRISFERHALAGLAKDLGSSAVVVAILMSAVCWIVIAGPIAIQWVRR